MSKVAIIKEIVESADLSKLDKEFCSECFAELLSKDYNLEVTDVSSKLVPSDDNLVIELKFSTKISSVTSEIEIRKIRKLASEATKRLLRERLDSSIFKIVSLDLNIQ